MTVCKANTQKAKRQGVLGAGRGEASKQQATLSTPNTCPSTWEAEAEVLTRAVPGAKEGLVKCENQILAEVCQLRSKFGDRVRLMDSELACELEFELSNEAIYKGVVLVCGFPEGYPSITPLMKLLDKHNTLDVQSLGFMQDSLASTLAEVFGTSGGAKGAPSLQVAQRLSSILHDMPKPKHSQVQSSTVFPTVLSFSVMPMPMLVPCVMPPVMFNHTLDSSKWCNPELEQKENMLLTASEPAEMSPAGAWNRKQNSRPLRTSEFMKFDVDLEKVKMGIDTRTSVMLRSIPRADTKETIMDFLEQCGLASNYTFFYMPFDRQKRAQHLGMAFVDFKSPEHILTLCGAIRSHRKRLRVSYSRVQGHEELLQHFASSAVMNHRIMSNRPVFCADLSD
eukprot:TRINITY_DN1755_c0_g1_i2.p1 TRINITY_DN1755_c0_g1~~TRINITY_DN1755_c0_g1_i2.p1  ORF type:complete len:395 (+),score=75.48 TRINITY_DN1755_c0_g1_i2:119-1303(+)